MEYIYANKRDSHIDEMSKPENLIKALPHYRQKLDLIADMRKATDDAAVSGPGGFRMAGYVRGRAGPGASNESPGLKVIARIPEALLNALVDEEPDLIRDASLWKAWIHKHPEFRAYSPGSKL
jgi:hypothetical protein